MMETRSTIAIDAADAVRTFYTDVLGGREVCSTRADDAGDSLWFLVGSELLAVRVRDGSTPLPAVIAVDAPEEVAERCWDAGFLVHVDDDASGGATLAVVDPLGRRIQLTASSSGHLTSTIGYSPSTTKSA